MKKTILIIILLATISKLSLAQNTTPNIKQFWLVMIKTGPKDKEITDSTERSKLFAGHFSNMGRLHSEGILKAAGPFGKNDFTWRGLFILDCKTKEEAENYVKQIRLLLQVFLLWTLFHGSANHREVLRQVNRRRRIKKDSLPFHVDILLQPFLQLQQNLLHPKHK